MLELQQTYGKARRKREKMRKKGEVEMEAASGGAAEPSGKPE